MQAPVVSFYEWQARYAIEEACSRVHGTASRSDHNPNNGVSNSPLGLVFFGVTLRSLCQNIQPTVAPTLKS